MPADEAPQDDDEQVCQSYNFAPSYHGLIYRAATNDRGTDSTPLDLGDNASNDKDGEPSPKKVKLSSPTKSNRPTVDGLATKKTKYKIQAAKWGLIPFWTKRAPDYGSMMRTINCRDDSLSQNGGMWQTMKQRKRCIVIAEGFYEWLKKNNGRDKIPHYTKRKDGQLMCFAGLWDCVQYEDSDEKLYTYTVITTDSNKALKFLHDRMPVILEPGSEAMRLWLDPKTASWNSELQSLLRPFDGELECYPVDKGVGKVGNNSPNFVVPIDSKENKSNIANFFGNQQKKKESAESDKGAVVKQEDKGDLTTSATAEDPESNAPLPKPASESEGTLSQTIKKEVSDLDDESMIEAANKEIENSIHAATADLDDEDLFEAEKSPPQRSFKYESAPSTPIKPPHFGKATAKREPTPSPSVKKTPSKTRSATSNGTVAKTPTKKDNNAKITSFFGK